MSACPACGCTNDFSAEYVAPQKRERGFLFWHSKKVSEAVIVHCGRCGWEKHFAVGEVKLTDVEKS